MLQPRLSTRSGRTSFLYASALRGNISGIFTDARKDLEKLIPIPELQELDQLMRATIDSIVDLLNESAKEVSEC